MLGIEWARPAHVAETVAAPTAVVTTRPTPASVPPAVPAVTAPAPVDLQQPVAQPQPQPQVIEPETPQAVSTVGLRRAVNIQRPVEEGPAPATFRSAANVEPPLAPRAGEVSDDYVAPQLRDPGYQERPAATSGIAPRQAVAVTPAPSAVTPTIAATIPQPTPVPAAAPPPPVATVARGASAVTVPSAPIPSGRLDESRVTQVINQYARAYGRLDASAARAVWPSVDERALARAFASLESQDVSFDNCDVSVSGATATASCRGHASFVGKVGSREPRTERRQWTFELRRDGSDAWKIENAQAQRLAYSAQ